MSREIPPDRVVAVIPARGGSKGIPLKNIRMVCGHPLIHYIVQASLESRKVGHTVVSTDNEEIAEVASACGAQIVQRPSGISTDISTSEEAVLHALDALREQGSSFDIALLLQATSPLTRPETIDALVERVEEGFDSSGCVSELRVFLVNDPELQQRPMRQARKPKMHEAGNGWAFRVPLFKKVGNRICGKQGTVCVSAPEAIEIDDPEDLLIAEALLCGIQEDRLKSQTESKTRMIVRVDIDGTICKTEGMSYEAAIPIMDNIRKINALHDAGHIIIYWTARGSVTDIDWTETTRRQLESWGCQFNKLEKKPHYDLHIDDKSMRIEEI